MTAVAALTSDTGPWAPIAAAPIACGVAVPRPVGLMMRYLFALSALGIGAFVGMVYWGVERRVTAGLHACVMRKETIR